MAFKLKPVHGSLLLSLYFGSAVASAMAQASTPSVSPESAQTASSTPALQDTATPPMENQAPAATVSPPPDPVAPAGNVENSAPPAAASAPESCCALPDGSPVQLEVVDAISSKTAQRGQTFALRLTHPLSTAEGVLLPAGTTGVVEVIHAERSRGGGKAGELILGARYLQGPDGPIKLRGMKLGGSGRDKTAAAMGASLILPLGGFVRGSEIEIPAGTPASAKLAGAIRLPPMTVATPNMDTTGATPAPVIGRDTSAPATPPASALSSPASTPL